MAMTLERQQAMVLQRLEANGGKAGLTARRIWDLTHHLGLDDIEQSLLALEARNQVERVCPAIGDDDGDVRWRIRVWRRRIASLTEVLYGRRRRLGQTDRPSAS